MSVTEVQLKPGTQGSGGTVPRSFDAPTTPGNIIVALVGFAALADCDVASITDDGGNTYTLLPQQKFAGDRYTGAVGTRIGYCLNANAATTITGNLTTNSSINVMSIYELTAGVLDQGAGAMGNSQFGSAGSYTPSSDGTFTAEIVVIDDNIGGGGSHLARSGWTLDLHGGGGALDWVGDSLVQSMAAALTGTTTLPIADKWAASMATFKPSGPSSAEVDVGIVEEVDAAPSVTVRQPQVLVPTADISAGGWTPSTGSDLFAMLNETQRDDATYVYSSPSPSVPDPFEVRIRLLGNVSPGNPAQDDDGVLHLPAFAIGKRFVDGDQIDFTVRLLEGATEIASWDYADVGYIADEPLRSEDLTNMQANAITDYANLRLRFECVAV